MAPPTSIWRLKGEEDRGYGIVHSGDSLGAFQAGMISSRQMKRQFAGKMVLYILLDRGGGGAADRFLASVDGLTCLWKCVSVIWRRRRC